MRPRIGITGPDRGGGSAWFFTALNIILAGGKPVRIRPLRPREAETLNGIVLGGGADVDPEAYTRDDFIDQYLSQTLKKSSLNLFQRISRFIVWLYYPFVFLLRMLFSRKSHHISKERDQLEFKLLNDIVMQGKPVLGICRGSQLINVYFKGTLYDNINVFYYEEPNPHSIFPVKTIYLKPGSKLSKILQLETLKVNALHNQAVKEKGLNIQIAAREKNQVVQGIEHTKQDFIIGVQWHPEYLLLHKHQRRIFRALTEAARKTSNQS